MVYPPELSWNFSRIVNGHDQWVCWDPRFWCKRSHYTPCPYNSLTWFHRFCLIGSSLHSTLLFITPPFINEPGVKRFRLKTPSSPLNQRRTLQVHLTNSPYLTGNQGICDKNNTDTIGDLDSRVYRSYRILFLLTKGVRVVGESVLPSSLSQEGVSRISDLG